MAGIDVHQHLWPPSFVAELSRRRAVPNIEGARLHLPDGSHAFDAGDHDLERRLALLDAAGIERAVVSLQPTLGLGLLPAQEREPLEQAWEEGALELAAASGGRILPLAPRRPRPGFAGVSVGADALDDLDKLAPTLDTLRGSGFLFVHPFAAGPRPVSPPWWQAVVDYTSQMQRAYFAWLATAQHRWPDVRVVFAILAGGAAVQHERLRSRGVDDASLRHDNVFFDTASYGPHALRLYMDAVGVGRLVFGTDVPVVDQSHAASALTPFGPGVESMVRERTPRALLA